MTATPARDIAARVHRRAVQLWLFAVAVLVFAMVLVGGATRLTESGLSITEWQPVMGALPPMSETQWQVELHRYQQIPQYRDLNAGMSLDAFKRIFWWEWTHRLLGRLIGVVFLVPLLWFLWRGWIGPGLRGRLWLIFALGALQGGVGWWMVASGLAHRVEVSQYRLAAHLVLACTIYIAILWTALRLGKTRGEPVPRDPVPQRAVSSGWARIRASSVGLAVLVLAQIYLGALVAGSRAGYIYNTWPLIDGGLLPSPARLFADVPLWRNFFENNLTIQFDHRMLAYAIWLLASCHLVDVLRTARRGPALAGALALFVAVTVQAGLGIATLLEVVPLTLAMLHQAMAMTVLTVAVMHAERLTRQSQPSAYPAALALPTSSRA